MQQQLHFLSSLKVVCLATLAVAACTFPELPPIDPDASPMDASVADAPPADAETLDAPDDAPTGPTYSVGGTVTGMWTGAAVVLEINAPPAAPERTAVMANGTFAFPTELPSGRAFTVSVASNGQPFMHNCTILNPNGAVTDQDISDRQATCTPEVAMSVSFTAPLVIPFDVARTTYSKIECPTPVQETRLVVTVPAGATLTINGGSASSGSTSNVFPLGTGITIHVVLGAISQDYTFTFDISGDVLNGPLYAKSSNSGMGDEQGVLSASGNLVAVGAPLEDSGAAGINQDQNNESSVDSGAVYIYRRVGLSWSQEAYLKASTNQADARFGASVSLSNEGNTATLVVGAPRFDGIGGVDSGAVHVFRRSAAGVWTEQQRLEPPASPAAREFGASVALNHALGTGNAVAIGAPRSTSDRGAAYVFRYNGSVWNQEKLLTAPNTEANDSFGSRVAMNGNLLAIGAPGEDSNGTGVNPATQSDNSSAQSGAVYLYSFAANDWSFSTYLKASNTGAGDAFGSSVSIENNLLAVGAPGEDSDGSNQTNNNATESGAAYVFELAGGTWQQLNYLKLGANLVSPEFGSDVCVHRDIVLVGATERLGSQSSNGVVRYFVRGATGFDFGSSLIRAPNGDSPDDFGASVSLSGEGMFVGAPHEASNARGFNTGLADNSAADSGAVYGYY